MPAFWKTGDTPTKARLARHRQAAYTERREKAKVRARDTVCRFPLCGCGPLGYALHVSHQRHKGMGGNPSGDRSVEPLMILLCAWRHLFGRVAVDKGNLKWEPLTPFGSRGAVAWFIKWDDGVWIPLAAETAPGVLEALTPGQRHVVDDLARMER